MSISKYHASMTILKLNSKIRWKQNRIVSIQLMRTTINNTRLDIQMLFLVKINADWIHKYKIIKMSVVKRIFVMELMLTRLLESVNIKMHQTRISILGRCFQIRGLSSSLKKKRLKIKWWMINQLKSFLWVTLEPIRVLVTQDFTIKQRNIQSSSKSESIILIKVIHFYNSTNLVYLKQNHFINSIHIY